MKARRFTLDIALDREDPPEVGDVLLKPHAVYRVLDVRPIDSQVWGNRWSLQVVRIGDRSDSGPDGWPAMVSPDARRHECLSYRKGERPAEYFAQFGGAQ